MEVPNILPPISTIPSLNEMLDEQSPSTPSPEVQAPPPENTKSPPPPTTVQSPPSNPTPPLPSPKLEESPPSGSDESNNPPNSQSPPLHPSNNDAPPANPPPSQQVNPSLSSVNTQVMPPPLSLLPSPPNDPQTISPPNDPQTISPPTDPSGDVLHPPFIPLSPPPAPLDSSTNISSPSVPDLPTTTPPSETMNSPVSGTRSPSLPTPITPQSSSPTTDSSPTSAIPKDSSTPPREISTNNAPQRESGSASNAPALQESSGSTGMLLGHAIAVSIAVVGILIILFAIFFLVSRKKRKRSEGLAVNYKPPSSYSVKSDGYYYRQANITNSAHFETESGFNTSSFRSTGMLGTQVDHMSYSVTPESPVLGNSKLYFTFDEVSEITQGFAQQNLLGEGGFGCVYKGWLADGRVVAVKQLKAGSGQGQREFKAEVEIISRVHHCHLVSLVGYCISEQHRSLVYEFVPNKTLEHHLHGKGLPMMDWPKRVKISIGSARGLAYLHEDCHPRIIHRDIKSANILLDDSFEAQVADFGLAKLSNDINTHVSTRVMGTFGYMAPEYASSGKLTDRSDVFSFGVVLLELITGRKPVDPSQPLGEESLVEWARPRLNHALETGNFEEVVDPRLQNKCVKSEMLRMMEVAAACVRHSGTKRPRMVQVLRALDLDGHLPDLSNGVKFGQSTVLDSHPYCAGIQQFHRMTFGSDSYSSDRTYTEEFDNNSVAQSGEYSSPEPSSRPLNASRQVSGGNHHGSHDYAPHSMNWQDSACSGGNYQFNGRGFR